MRDVTHGLGRGEPEEPNPVNNDGPMEHFLSSWGYLALVLLTVAEAAVRAHSLRGHGGFCRVPGVHGTTGPGDRDRARHPGGGGGCLHRLRDRAPGGAPLGGAFRPLCVAQPRRPGSCRGLVRPSRGVERAHRPCRAAGAHLRSVAGRSGGDAALCARDPHLRREPRVDRLPRQHLLQPRGAVAPALHGFSMAGYVLAALAVLAIAGFVFKRWRHVRSERENSKATGVVRAGRPGEEAGMRSAGRLGTSSTGTSTTRWWGRIPCLRRPCSRAWKPVLPEIAVTPNQGKLLHLLSARDRGQARSGDWNPGWLQRNMARQGASPRREIGHPRGRPEARRNRPPRIWTVPV